MGFSILSLNSANARRMMLERVGYRSFDICASIQAAISSDTFTLTRTVYFMFTLRYLTNSLYIFATSII